MAGSMATLQTRVRQSVTATLFQQSLREAQGRLSTVEAKLKKLEKEIDALDDERKKLKVEIVTYTNTLKKLSR
ncbi:hypothetical protein FSARC_4024 [Fusarium sarcochroum]|uniref:Uncharacterized protein n=1 Tax=Fusarium sarcochroum TaxID=1208366 RepID=A0A8H4XBS7_9HYPO|nr:hypothetical protein FSARC_4024 [Fusarium sarcochroum]